MAKSLKIPKGKSKKERQHNGQKFEDTKGYIEEGETTQWPKV